MRENIRYLLYAAWTAEVSFVAFLLFARFGLAWAIAAAGLSGLTLLTCLYERPAQDGQQEDAQHEQPEAQPEGWPYCKPLAEYRYPGSGQLEEREVDLRVEEPGEAQEDLPDTVPLPGNVDVDVDA
jgi:hypothetical protein